MRSLQWWTGRLASRLIRLLVYRVVARHTALVKYWNALLAIFFDCLLLLSDRLHHWFLYYHIWTMPSWGMQLLCLSRLDYRNMKVHKISNLYLVSSNGTIVVVFLFSLGSLHVSVAFSWASSRVDLRFLKYSSAASSWWGLRPYITSKGSRTLCPIKR